MKRVGIITFHFAHNVGAVLQCLALNEQLKKMDALPYVINYRPKYHVVKYEPWRPLCFSMCQRFLISREKSKTPVKVLFELLKVLVGTLYGNRNYFIKKKRKARFEDFISKFFEQSVLYEDFDKLVSNPPDADCYISGSDQVWNKALTNGKYDLAYFLKFGKQNVTRVAYAPSMGETDILENSDEFLDNIKDFDGVFFRETVDSRKLSDLTGNDYVSVNDPTLFLTMEEYEKFESKKRIEKPYIFVYTVLRSSIVQSVISKFSKEHGLSVIDGSTHHYLKGNDLKYDHFCAPGDFLTYIRNAEFVITNSFHGTVFSILYHKNFITIANKKRNSRIEELLDYVGLRDRLIYDDDYTNVKYLQNIDYEPIEEKLKIRRKHNTGILREFIK